MKTFLVVCLIVVFAIACNDNSADGGNTVDQDSITKSTLDNRDINNRNTTIYDSTGQKDTQSYERMPTKNSDTLKK